MTPIQNGLMQQVSPTLARALLYRALGVLPRETKPPFFQKARNGTFWRVFCQRTFGPFETVWRPPNSGHYQSKREPSRASP